MPKQILVLDSSQISTFLECPEKWRLSYDESITSTNAREEAMTAGTFGHKLLEIYYTQIGLGRGQKEAWQKAMSFDPDAADETDKHQYPLSQEMRVQIKDRFNDYIMTWGSRDYEPATRDRKVIGIDEYGLPKDVKIKDPLIEKGFSYELLNDSQYLFVLEGRIDFIGSVAGTTVWMDHKWQFRERQLYKKSIQFRNYALVTGLDLGVINYIRLHKKISETTFVRQAISFNAREREYWKYELIDIFVKIAKARQAGTLERNRDSCAGKFGYSCPFTSLCEEYNNETRATIRKQNFVEKIKWTPW